MKRNATKSTSNFFHFSCYCVIIICCREEEKCRIAYNAIMSIHPHLPAIVKACADYPDTFISLIRMVRFYIKLYAHIYSYYY